MLALLRRHIGIVSHLTFFNTQPLLFLVRSESPTGRRLSAPIAAAPHKWEDEAEAAMWEDENEATTGYGGGSECLLWHLPDELLMYILGFLEARDLTSIVLVSRPRHRRSRCPSCLALLPDSQNTVAHLVRF